MIKQKSCHIETLRGIAILLVVLGHVIGSTSEGGMKVANDSFFRYLYDLFVNIRMPLFTVISGWVYALHPVKADNISIFLRRRSDVYYFRWYLSVLYISCSNISFLEQTTKWYYPIYGKFIYFLTASTGICLPYSLFLSA